MLNDHDKNQIGGKSENQACLVAKKSDNMASSQGCQVHMTFVLKI